MGFAFIEDALTWEPGARDDVLWYDGNDDIWHASLRDSDGLKPIPRKHVDPASLPDNLSKYYEDFMGHYRALHSQRLQPEKVEQ